MIRESEKRVAGRYSAALIGLVLAGTCVQAQVPKKATGTEAPLPEVVRLRKRGKAGDTYMLQNTMQASTEMRITGLPTGENQQTILHEENGTESVRVRSVNPQGILETEVRELSHKTNEVKDGLETKKSPPLKAWLETYQPNGLRIKRVPLAVATPKTGKAGKSRPVAKKVSPQEDDEFAVSPAFPDTPMRVGDTWATQITLLPKSLSDDPKVAVKAKLIALERFQGVPCATIEYTLDEEKEGVPKAFRSEMPDSLKITGKTHVTGTITNRVSLDRGFDLGTTYEINMDLKFQFSGSDPNGGVINAQIIGTVSLNGKETVPKFPTFDPALVPVVK